MQCYSVSNIMKTDLPFSKVHVVDNMKTLKLDPFKVVQNRSEPSRFRF